MTDSSRWLHIRKPDTRARRFRPGLESLERRDVPAVLTVTNLLDGVAGSLRAEVSQAQNGDTIQFADGLNGQITLLAGEIDVNHSVDIEGPGADVIAVSGNQSSRIFNVPVNQTVTIAGLTITNGKASGSGGFLNAGTLTLNKCVVSDNSGVNASGVGGGAYNTGTLTLNDCIFTDNSAAGVGGGIANGGSLTINHSHIVHNIASGGGAVGGGIDNTGTLSATDSDISDNASIRGDAGGLYNGGTASLTRCTVSDNQAGLTWGGGAFNRGRLTVASSTFTGNRAPNGGGIYDYGGAPTLIITSSTFADNSATGNGGAINNNSDALALTNDTFFRNVAANGGAIYYTDFGSGVSMGVVGCTLAGNSATGHGGGVDEVLLRTNTTLALTNTIVAGDTAGMGNDIFGPVIPTSDHNLVGDGNGSSGLIDGINGNQVGFYGAIDPMFDPNGLWDNGGPSQTIALEPGSPAIDAGNNAGATQWDQRGPGFPRIVNGTIDIGAFEVQNSQAAAFQVTAPAKVVAGTPFSITVTAVDTQGNVVPAYTGTVTFSTSDPDQGVVRPADYTFTAADGGVHTFTNTGLGETTLITRGYQTLTVTDTADGSVMGSATVKVRHLRRHDGGSPGVPAGQNLAADRFFAALLLEDLGLLASSPHHRRREVGGSWGLDGVDW